MLTEIEQICIRVTSLIIYVSPENDLLGPGLVARLLRLPPEGWRLSLLADIRWSCGGRLPLTVMPRRLLWLSRLGDALTDR